MKKKLKETWTAIITVFVIILFIISLILAYGIASFFAQIIPFPIVIGGIFGFGFGWLVYEKKIF